MIRCALLIGLVALAATGPPASAHDITWETAPVLQVPAAWRSAAVDHWAMPGVPTVQEACGAMPTTRRVPDTGGGEGAWGRTRGTFTIRVRLDLAISDPAAYAVQSLPCAIWFEEDYLTLLAGLGARQRGRDGCETYAHEFGHALGLSHTFRGDAASVMGAGRAPECAKAYPARVERCRTRRGHRARRCR